MKKKNSFLSCLIVIISVMCFITISCKKETNNNTNNDLTVEDIDGNVYHTLTIGTQVWMAENLKTTKFRNGDLIPNIIDNNIWWTSYSSPAYCNYNNDINISLIYGRLYNWYAINDSRKIAPIGWHVPSKEEWQTLINYLGGESIAGGKLKESGTIHWQNPNIGASNAVGFNGLPSGWRGDGDGSFGDLGISSSWWSSSQASSNGNAIDFEIYNNESSVYWNSQGADKVYGFSIRCIKD